MLISGLGSTGAGFQPVIMTAYSIACMAVTAMLRYALPCMVCLALVACGKPATELEQVQAHNELIVITRNSPTTYYEGPDGPVGFEYELAKRFSEYIGVELRVVVPANFSDILPLTALGDANLAEDGLTVKKKRQENVILLGL